MAIDISYNLIFRQEKFVQDLHTISCTYFFDILYT